MGGIIPYNMEKKHQPDENWGTPVGNLPKNGRAHSALDSVPTWRSALPRMLFKVMPALGLQVKGPAVANVEVG